jgi:hypothetical protein
MVEEGNMKRDILQQNKKAGIKQPIILTGFMHYLVMARLANKRRTKATNKKSLHIGCGSGHSLLYMADKGAYPK